MKSENNDVALQGIEFWSTVCDEEQDLAIEAAEVILSVFDKVLWRTKWRRKVLFGPVV